MGMISYRTPQGYQGKFGRDIQDRNSSVKYGSSVNFKAQSYLVYQGQKFLSRFDPVTYVKMTEQMDSHDIVRGRGDSVEQVLKDVQIPALVLGIDSDVLYPLSEQKELVAAFPQGQMRVISSPDGHDGFLLEQEQVGSNITEFLDGLQ
jgi:homoserine O-acetyltransferase